MRKTLQIRQRDSTDCGAACLTAICRHCGIATGVGFVRILAGTDHQGTSVYGLMRAASKLGLQATAVRTDAESLTALPCPAIMQIQLHGRDHFVVLVSVAARHVTIMDPAEGRYKKLSKSRFLQQWSGVSILFSAPERSGDPVVHSAWRFVLNIIREHRGGMLTLLILAAGVAIVSFVVPLYVRQLVDLRWNDGTRDTLRRMSVIALTLVFVHFWMTLMRGYIGVRMARTVDRNMITAYYRRLLELPQQFFNTMRVGDITSRLADAVKISGFLTETLSAAVIDLLAVIFSAGIMLVFNWQLTLCVAMALPCYLLVFWWNHVSGHKWQRELLGRSSRLHAQLVESVSGIETIKRLNLTDWAYARHTTLLNSLLHGAVRSSMHQFASLGVADCVTRCITVVTLWIGSTYVIDRALSAGELIAFYALTGYLTGSLLGLMALVRPVNDLHAAAERLFDIMDIDTDVSGNVTCGPIHTIEFRQVGFAYGVAEPVLSGVSFFIHGGTITGLRGGSGSGKSTVAALLHRLYVPLEGSILINGFDIASLDVRSLRERIAVVSQHTTLFSGTVFENIAVGDEKASIGKVQEICRRIGSHDFLMALEHGYDTIIHEHGSNLSGGQRQRIAIARALYRCPDVLVLDEATSALDTNAEQSIMEGLKWYNRRGMTILIIAHHASVLEHCSDMIVLAPPEL